VWLREEHEVDDEITRQVTLARPPARIWHALTAADQLSAWFGAEVEIDPRPRGRITFRWPGGRVRDAVIEVAEPPRLLVLRWLPFERDRRGQARQVAAGRISFVLEAAGTGSRLTVKESRPKTSPEGSLQMTMSG
jgi:uncharacterized protein YndB with AHSA1/START domain